MSWKSPGYHLRVFALCLGAVAVALIGVLFGVRMESITHASGVVSVRDTYELRAPFAGVVELGWYEGEVVLSDRSLKVRLDRHGNGITNPATKDARTLKDFKCKDGAVLTLNQLRFRKLQTGDIVWPEQPIAHVWADEHVRDLRRWKGKLEDLEARKETAREAEARYQSLRELLSHATLTAAGEGKAFQVLKVYASPGQPVQSGEVLLTLAPVDASTGQPRDWIVQLEVHEKHASGVEPGQEVRLYSTMYNQRLHGHAEGVVERVEPCAEPTPSSHGERYFRVQAKITQAPYSLHPGSSVKAEIVLGHKPVYRIILEQ